MGNDAARWLEGPPESNLDLMGVPTRALYQAFLPAQGRDQAHVWKFSWEFGGRRPLHFHAEPEINLVVSGRATFRVGEALIEATRGDMLSFPPGQDHQLLETSPDVYLFAIGLEQRLSSEVLRQNQERAVMPMHVRLSPQDFSSLLRRSEAVVDRDEVDQLTAELWEHSHWLCHRYFGRAEIPMHVIVRRALSVLSEHPDWDCERVAQMVRGPACELSRYFHRDLGITFVKYRTRLRLLRYIRAIDQGATNLMTAANVAGFGSYSQCHRAFHAELGCYPRQFFQSGFREQMQLLYAPYANTTIGET